MTVSNQEGTHAKSKSLLSRLCEEARLSPDYRPASPELARLGRRVARAPESLAMSYGRAARILLDAGPHPERRHGVHLDMPMFFLVRHSVELALKDLLWAYHASEEARRDLDKARRKPSMAKPLQDRIQKKLGTTHDIGWLLVETILHLESHVTPHLGGPWTDLVNQITALENNHHEWSRYQSSRETPFDRPVKIPVKGLIQDLEAFLKQAVFLNADLNDRSVFQELMLEYSGLTQKLHEANQNAPGSP